MISIIVILVFTLLVAYYFFNKKTLKIKKDKKMININEILIERADIQHYNNTKIVYNKKRFFYPDPRVIFENETDIQVPQIVDYHLNRDVQNVHDTCVQKNLSKKYKDIHKTVADNLDEIRNYPKEQEQKEKISEIIDLIQKRNSFIINFNAHEVEILKNIWFSSDENVKDAVILNLLDCVDEYGLLYCPTGVSSRIISSSQINNPESMPKDETTLKNEILIVFSKHYTITKSKDLAKKHTIEEYSNLYPYETIEGLINEWFDDIY